MVVILSAHLLIAHSTTKFSMVPHQVGIGSSTSMDSFKLQHPIDRLKINSNLVWHPESWVAEHEVSQLAPRIAPIVVQSCHQATQWMPLVDLTRACACEQLGPAGAEGRQRRC